MRILILSIALTSIAAPIYSTNNSANVAPAKLNEYEVFAQKYEAAFGEKPSNQIWNLGKKNCGANCTTGGCSTGRCQKS